MKRYFFTILCLLGAFFQVSAQMVWTQRYQDYFDQYNELAVEQMLKYKIPASITLAQGVLESAAGKSDLAIRGFNHFGIKCKGWTGRKTYHDDDEMGECFRAYNSVYESYEDHSQFLVSNKRYSQLFQLNTTDYKGWAKGLKACGYATSPTYAQKLIEIIELYKLDRYDQQKHYEKQQKQYDKFQTQQIAQGDERHIYAFNSNYYVKARRGDTFRSIAEDVDIPYKKLAKYNERDKDDALEEGELIWLMKKAKKAPKDYKGKTHVVRAGESMYSIAQLYGIRLKSLYKLNNLTPDYVIRIGDRLVLR